MFIIFGWGRQTVKNHGPVFRYHCDRCKNEEFWQLYSKKTWFTLFFIPVIPYSSEHLMLCPVCSYGVVLDGAKFEEMKAVADCNMDLINKRITEEEHRHRINQLVSGQGEVYGNNNSHQLSGKTETQINYLREMDEAKRRKEESVEEYIDNNPALKRYMDKKDE